MSSKSQWVVEIIFILQIYIQSRPGSAAESCKVQIPGETRNWIPGSRWRVNRERAVSETRVNRGWWAMMRRRDGCIHRTMLGWNTDILWGSQHNPTPRDRKRVENPSGLISIDIRPLRSPPISRDNPAWSYCTAVELEYCLEITILGQDNI